MSDHDPAREDLEPPGGWRRKTRPQDDPSSGARPDWLVGADEALGSAPRSDLSRPTLVRPGAAEPPPQAESPARAPLPGSTPEAPAATPEPAAWAAAASSVPKLTVVSRRERPVREENAPADLGSEPGAEPERRALEEDEGESESIAAPEEPWWLVAVETLATNRLLQVGIAAVVAVAFAWGFWPRRENETVAIASIKQHPQRFEGQSVRIRGEVGEVFDVGSGVVFELHQRRDTLVVFSPSRRPALHDHLMVQGTVSTGYLDGTPRVALFEAPGTATR